MRAAVPAMIASQLVGVGEWQPAQVNSSREAALVPAQMLVHGYYDVRGGRLHFEFLVEDAQTHRMRRVAAHGDALAAATALARTVDPAASPFPTDNLEAVEAWGRGEFDRAVELDTDFGLAWRERIQGRRSAPAEALALADQALARSGLRSQIDRTQIEYAAALLREDAEAAARAGGQLLDLLPRDAGLAKRLGEQVTLARHFELAAIAYQRLTELEPEESSHYNLLGYALFFKGELKAARATLTKYTGMPGQEANGLDSEGEVFFMAGQFAEADGYFLRAHQADPNLLAGADLLKAAYARWLSGDREQADRIFDQFARFRAEAADSAVVWRRAKWEYSTGRKDQAVARLRAVTGAAEPLARSQLAVWAGPVPEDVPTLERAYRSVTPSADGVPRVLLARALWKVGKRVEAARLVEPWPLPDAGEPLLDSLLYPVYLELRQQVGK